MSKKPSRHLIEKLLDQEKYRLHVALATEEGEWNQHEPNSGMARMFVVMLLLHVLLIGGIVIYDILDDEQTENVPVMTVETEAAKVRNTDLSTPEVEKGEPLGAVPEVPVVDPEGYEKYTVKSGDTLQGIAKSLNVDKDALVKLNGIDQGAEFGAQTTLLVPHEKLPEVSADEAPVPSAIAVDRDLFEPRDGAGSSDAGGTRAETAPMADTLDAPPALAVEKEAPKAIPMPQLEKRPDVSPKAPVVVESEVVKPKPPPATPAAVEASPAPAASRIHTLAPGETLYRLSILYGVSVSAIQSANDIQDPGKLQIGAKLVIPGK